MRSIIIVTALAPFAAFAANSAARAQEAPAAFTGECKSYTEAASCDATKWCHFVNRKPVTLPDGKTYQPKGYCGFRAGFKAAWKDTQGK